MVDDYNLRETMTCSDHPLWSYKRSSTITGTLSKLTITIGSNIFNGIRRHEPDHPLVVLDFTCLMSDYLSSILKMDADDPRKLTFVRLIAFVDTMVIGRRTTSAATRVLSV